MPQFDSMMKFSLFLKQFEQSFAVIIPNMRNRLLLSISITFSLSVFGQENSNTGYAFLNLPFSARTAALGGSSIAVRDLDINLGLSNPALLNDKMNKQGSINQGFIASGATFGALTYGRSLKYNITGAAHFRYLAYGKMNRTEIDGTTNGTFAPGDFALGVSGAKAINERMFFGATLNLIYSQIDSYVSFGNSLDLGGNYIDPERRLSLAGTIKNIGIQWVGFNKTRSPLPLEIQLAATHQLAHAPFRFSLLGHHLQKWDLTYQGTSTTPKVDPLTGEPVEVKTPKFFGKLSRHFIVQTEILLGQKLEVRFAFDYNRRQALKLSERPGLSGFSMGVGAAFKRFRIDYGYYVYSVAGSQQNISLSLPIGSKK